MEILSYNIMSGCFNSYDSVASRPERLDLLIKTIKSINADFVSLVDTHRWTEIFVLDDLKNLFGYENIYSVKLEDERLKIKGHDNGITVLTRLPVQNFETVRLFSRNAIKTVLDGLDIFSIYLDDMSEDTRVQQLQALLPHLSSSRPTVIMGDMNTLDQDDLITTKKTLENFYDQNPGAKSMEPITSDMARAEATRLLISMGLVDMGKEGGNTMPSKLFPIKLDNPILRLDYGFCTPNIKVERFEVLRDDEFDKLSDHFPIKMRVTLD